MKPIAIVAWLSFAGAAIFLFLFLNAGIFAYLSAAIASLFAGLAFLALHKIIELLTEIRDNIRAAPAASNPATEDRLEVNEPTRSIAEIEASIENAKQRHMTD
ncbi:hypothetical protein ACJ5NV_19260 [Loktanella agnita]|uniref:hypothetical protein n=1 Tax=Loktanella agnita TaxID=287097 RepID=UPI00398A074A